MEGVPAAQPTVLHRQPRCLRWCCRIGLRPLRGARVTELSEASLGERISILFRIGGDPEHPFSEVTGVLMRIAAGESTRTFHVVRRTGEVVEVPEDAVVKLKLIPPGTGPIKAPPGWSGAGSEASQD
ncbi:MAG: putative acetyltransferase [Actinomycetota bacterium]